MPVSTDDCMILSDSDDDVFMYLTPSSSVQSTPSNGFIPPPPTPVQTNSTGPFTARKEVHLLQEKK